MRTLQLRPRHFTEHIQIRFLLRNLPPPCEEIETEWGLAKVMLKLKLQYFGHLMWRVDWLEKTVMLGGIGVRRRRGRGWEGGWDGWMASPTQWAWVWVNSGSLWWTGRTGMLRFMGLQRVGHDWATELNWSSYLQKRSLIPRQKHMIETRMNWFIYLIKKNGGQ